MADDFVNVLLTMVPVLAVSEISRKSSLFGGLLASLPLVSFLGLIGLYVDWLYADTGSTRLVVKLSQSSF